MNWKEACEHPSLQNLPFKIELNEQGQVVMSPLKIKHSFYQGKILKILDKLLPEGQSAPEVAIHTKKGTKVADVAWCSAERFHAIEHDTEAHIAPEICIEVLSVSNTKWEMQMKRELYFEQGAEEVWICDAQGSLRFYNTEGELPHSKRVPQFPNSIQLS